MKNHKAAVPGAVLDTTKPSGIPVELVFATSADLVLLLDAEGTIYKVSPRSFSLLGYTPSEIQGRNLSSIISENDRGSSLAAVKLCRESNIIHFESRCRKKDGCVVPFAWSCSWDKETGLAICFGREDLPLKLRYQETAFDTQRVAEGFFTVDRELRIIDADPQFDVFLKTRFENYTGMHLFECFPASEDSVFSRMYLKAIQEKMPVHFEAFFEPLSAWYELHAHPFGSGLSVHFRDISERKKAEEERDAFEKINAEQNQMMVEVLEQMDSGFLTMRPDGKVLYWNREAERITGIPRSVTLGKMMWDLFPGIQESPFFSLYNKLLHHAGPVHEEVFSPYRSRWVEIHAYTTANGISVFFRDIHDRKMTEEELHKLSLIVKDTNNGISIVNLQGRISWVNDAYSRITGYTLEEAAGKTNAELLSGPREDFNSEAGNEHCYRGKPWKVEMRCFNKEGKEIWIESSGQPLYDKEGNFQQYFEMLTEITERKKAEEELQKLSLIAEQTINAVAISDSERNVLWVNKALQDLSGYSFEEAVGKKTWDLFDGPETDPAIVAFTQNCVEMQQPFRVEVLNYKKNGVTYWANVSCQPLFDKQGNLQCFFSIATDITDRKKLEVELEAQRHSTTAAVISAQERERALVGQELHDNVNQVLTTVKLYTELCRDGIGNTGEIFDKSLVLLQDSINEIRNLSKRLSAPTLGNIRFTDSVKELVAAIEATNKVSISLDFRSIKNIDVNQEMHLALYRILQEHFTNILRHAEAANVSVILSYFEGQLQLRVIDDGKGFNTFQKSKGIGITNMVTRTEGLNGKIFFKSQPGCGCELEVSIPLPGIEAPADSKV